MVDVVGTLAIGADGEYSIEVDEGSDDDPSWLCLRVIPGLGMGTLIEAGVLGLLGFNGLGLGEFIGVFCRELGDG